MKKWILLMVLSFWFVNCASNTHKSQKNMRTLTEISKELAMVDESLVIVNQRLEDRPKDRTLRSLKQDLTEQKKSLERRQRYYQTKI